MTKRPAPSQKRKAAPWDPTKPEKLWIAETILKLGAPSIVEQWEEKQLEILADPKKFAKRKCKPAAPPKTKAVDKAMQHGALNSYFPVSKTAAQPAGERTEISVSGNTNNHTSINSKHTDHRSSHTHAPSTPKKKSQTASLGHSPGLAKYFLPRTISTAAQPKSRPPEVIMLSSSPPPLPVGSSLPSPPASVDGLEDHGKEVVKSDKKSELQHESYNVPSITDILRSSTSSVPEPSLRKPDTEPLPDVSNLETNALTLDTLADPVSEVLPSSSSPLPLSPHVTKRAHKARTKPLRPSKAKVITSARKVDINRRLSSKRAPVSPPSEKTLPFKTKKAVVSRKSLAGTWKFDAGEEELDAPRASDRRPPRVSIVDLTGDD